ncbi:MAG: rRNA maturation RNase YbeY [Erysipelotrichia bacterium]|nr:rRNA maturation RNase YbeY [Erysipelotrichia bacterium]NCC54369.1 rRNA maturation RNase YbeY [Erysipelotrichia bacterium]
MEVNIVSQIEFTLEKKNQDLFNQIVDRTKEVLQIDKPYSFSVIFVNDTQIHEINRDYRHIDRPTDVITFASLMDGEDTYEMMEEDFELGDVFINIDATFRQAQEYGHSFDRELSFLFTHGLLHLLGYDHIEKEEEEKMFSLQEQILDEIIKK